MTQVANAIEYPIACCLYLMYDDGDTCYIYFADYYPTSCTDEPNPVYDQEVMLLSPLPQTCPNCQTTRVLLKSRKGTGNDGDKSADAKNGANGKGVKPLPKAPVPEKFKPKGFVPVLDEELIWVKTFDGKKIKVKILTGFMNTAEVVAAPVIPKMKKINHDIRLGLEVDLADDQMPADARTINFADLKPDTLQPSNYTSKVNLSANPSNTKLHTIITKTQLRND